MAEWIDVNERLPENDYEKHWKDRQYYLVLLKPSGLMRVAKYGYKEYNWWIDGHDSVLDSKFYTEVSHWMPLPEPPRTPKERGGGKMKVAINLNTITDIEKFTALVQTVKSDVRLTGKDENGNDWNLSAKSLLCSIVVSTKLQKDREHTAHEVDWNTIYCECEEDIYSLIQDYVKV